MKSTFGAIKTGTLFILEWDGCCYMKIGFTAIRPHKTATYSIQDFEPITIISDCLVQKGETL